MQILELELLTHRLEDQRRFYAGLLGLPLVEATAESVTLAAGGTMLTFASTAGGSEPLYHFAFNIPENQLPEAKAWLSERVELVVHEGKDQFGFPDWHAEAVYFRDPAGNIGELIARHDLDNASHEPFDPASILSR